MSPASAANVRGALQAIVLETLAERASSSGYSLKAVVFDEAVELAFEKDGATFVLWLRPATDDTQWYKATARFRIGLHGTPVDDLGYAAVDAVCERIETWECTLPEDAHLLLFERASRTPSGAASDLQTLALEGLAVRTGLKPACRILTGSDSAAGIVEQARAMGLHAHGLDDDVVVSDFCAGAGAGATLLYVARTAAAAAAVAAVEGVMIEECRRGGRVTADQIAALGTALGYPRCCIDAFLPIRDRSPAEIRFHAMQHTARDASFLLNDTDERRTLVSHAVCRYDCPASIKYAGALLRELAREHPAAAPELESTLRGLVALFRSGGALRFAGAVSTAARTYTFAAVKASGEGPALEHWRAALRGADGLEILDGELRVVAGARETGRLLAPPDEVQVRWFG